MVQENKGKNVTLKTLIFPNDLYYFLQLRCRNIPFASPDNSSPNSLYDCPFRHVWLVYF